MSEANQGQPKQLLLIALVVLLFVIVCVQAAYMVGMEKQLEGISAKQSPTQLVAQDASSQVDEPAEPATTENTTNNRQSSLQEQQAQSQSRTRNENFFNSPYPVQTWDPYEDIRRLQQHMDRVFNEKHNRISKRPDYEYRFSRRVSTPKIDVREDNNQYMVFVNIPGTDEDNISVNLKGQRLTIKAKQGYEKKDSDPTGRIIIRERTSGRFQRSITLREPVDQKGMRTRVNNGVLTVMIPKIRW